MERCAVGWDVGVRWVMMWVRSSEGRVRRGDGGMVVGVVRRVCGCGNRSCERRS